MLHTCISLTVIILFRASLALSQSVCIWGRDSSNAIINGLYTLSGYYEGAPVYVKEGCHTLYLYYEPTTTKWYIDDKQSEKSTIASCASPSVTDCDSWFVLESKGYVEDHDTYAVPDKCPSLSCDQVSIPSLSNGCDVLFDVALGENIWTDSSNTRYWYFNPWFFQWQCAAQHPSVAQCDGPWSAYSDTGWTDIKNGETSTLFFQSPPASYSVHCIADTFDLTDSSHTTISPIISTERIVQTNSTNVYTTHISSHIATNTQTNAPITATPFNPETDSTKADMSHITSRIVTNTANPLNSAPLFEAEVIEITQYKKVMEVTEITTEHKPFWIAFYTISVVILCCLVFVLVVVCHKLHNEHNPDVSVSKISHLVQAKPDIHSSNSGDVQMESDQVQKIEYPSCRPLRLRVNTDSHIAENNDAASGERELQLNDVTEDNVICISMEEIKVSPTRSFSSSAADSPVEPLPARPTLEGHRPSPEGVPCGADNATFVYQPDDAQLQMLQEWLTKTVQLPQYYEVLVKNGYDSLNIVKEIKEEAELEEIGINLKGHILILQKEIQRLRDMYLSLKNLQRR